MSFSIYYYIFKLRRFRHIFSKVLRKGVKGTRPRLDVRKTFYWLKFLLGFSVVFGYFLDRKFVFEFLSKLFGLFIFSIRSDFNMMLSFFFTASSDEPALVSTTTAPQVATKSKPMDSCVIEKYEQNLNPGKISSCDTFATEEPEPTVIPLPSTLSLVTEEPLESMTENDSQSSMIFSIPTLSAAATTVNPETVNPGIFGTTAADESSSMDNFENEIMGKEIRPPSIEPTLMVMTGAEPIIKNEIKLETQPSGPPYTCQYCQRQYDNRRRYEIHVRHHTGETPFKCHICPKGFRDDRKLKLHVARHTGNLPNKCHLCPRSFEGPNSLQKHLLAHESGRVVQPKMIRNADGTTAIALPTDNGVGGHGSSIEQVVLANQATVATPTEPDQTTTGIIFKILTTIFF